MAGSSSTKGFQCQFLDPVLEDYYCKQCTLVARKLSFTSCCGESYCNGCISSIKQANKPCPNPECGEGDFNISQQVKYQRKILSSQVYCMKKEKGCGWQGKLEELDSHLDPDKGDCEYIDVQCPLKCDQEVTKKNITEHVANECVQRDFICPYCAFKATYEIVSTVHYPECSYYPLPCPNRCGVTCERSTMEDHMNICPLEVVECEFKHVGCEMKFVRDEKDEHMREKSQTHLTMMATSLARMQEGFQQLLLEKEKSFEEKLKAQEEMFEKEREQQKKDFNEKLKAEREQQKRDLDQKLKAQEERFAREREKQNKDLDGKIKAQEERFEREQEQQKKYLNEKLKLQEEMFETERKQQKKETVEKLKEQEMKLTTQVEHQNAGYEQWKEMMEGNLVGELEKIRRFYCLHQELMIKINPVIPCSSWPKAAKHSGPNQHQQKKWGITWYLSPATYTHLYGYKFCIGIETEGYEQEQWGEASVSVLAMRGEFDEQLKWPVRAEFTLELANHFQNGENKKFTKIMEWSEDTVEQKDSAPFPQSKKSLIGTFYTMKRSEVDRNPAKRTQFLKNSTLYFRILDIKTS